MRGAFYLLSFFWARCATALSAYESSNKRDSPALSNATQKFVFDDTQIPDLDFGVGESYAGWIPISSDLNETRQTVCLVLSLYEYFGYRRGCDLARNKFAVEIPLQMDKVSLRLNRSHGCSSLNGLFSEHGPFMS